MLRAASALIVFSFSVSTTFATPISSLQGTPIDAPEAIIALPVDGSWTVLDEIMAAGSYYSPIFTYSSPNPVQMDVTDLFVVSDRNEVWLDGVLLGTTPAMPDWPALIPAVGPFDDAPYTSDPDVAWGRPEFSKTTLVLPAGSHMITLRNIHIPSNSAQTGPMDDGTVAFRLVPEPTTALLLVAAAITILLARRRATQNKHASVPVSLHRGSTATLLLAAVLPLFTVATVQAAPCGTLNVDVISNVLEIQGTTGDDSVRIVKNAGNPAIVDIYTPAGDATPSCSYDSTATPFGTVRVTADNGDDLIVFDDSNGAISDTWIIEVHGGGDEDIVLGGIDLNVTSLNDALTMIATLQQAQTYIDRVLDMLDAPQSTCNTASCLVENAATLAKDAGNNLVLPTANYVRDIESELVQPTAATVQKAHGRIANYLNNYIAADVQGISQEAQVISADVEVMIDEFELLLPFANDLLVRAQSLYDRAASLGMETQNGDPVALLMQTIESHVLTISELSLMCDEDPEPTETEFNEDLQDPSGLPPICAEVERRVEALEAITDTVEARVDQVELEGDAFEADGDALEALADSKGDDEIPSSNAAQMETQGDNLVNTGDTLTATTEALAADWEQWVAQAEGDLENRGDTMHTRGLNEVLAAADALDTQAQTSVEAAADALLAEADQLAADLDALMTAAAPILGDTLALLGTSNRCEVTPTNTLTGGPGNDVLIGSTGSDKIEGGDDADLIIGLGGDDELNGDDGNDLIFGGGGNDRINGGAKVDILVGNKGNDCIFGGGGQTLTRGSLSVAMGDIFFGVDGDDTIVAGDSEDDDPEEIDFVMGGADNDRVRVSHGGDLTIGSFTIKLGNLVFGGDGNDDILTKDGIDVLFGGNGEDPINAGKGAQLTIGSGSSQFRLALGDLIFGGGDNDTIDGDDPDADEADQDIDVIFGRDGDDTIHGHAGGLLSIGDVSDPDFELRLGNLIFGGNGKDDIDTTAGIDVIFGGDDDDTVSSAGKGHLLTIGDDDFRLALGDLLFGGNGNDELHGDDPEADRADDDIDVIFGRDGDDTIFGYGGGLLSIGDSSDPDFELKLGNVIFGGDQNDEIETLDGIDLIFCGAGDDTASAGKGHVLNINDTFKIDLGDLIFGQAGNDTLHGDAADPPEGGDEHDGIDLIFGASGDDNIYGCTGGNIELPDQDFCLLFGNLLFGGPDNDLIRADYENQDTDNPQGGIDLAFGAGGNDTIEGKEGSLIIIGDISSGQAVIIFFGNLLFGGPGNDTIQGANGSDLCSGVNEDLDELLNDLGVGDLGGAADLIFCGPGNDEVDAYNGIDLVFGADGDDILRADHGGIVVVPISGVPTPIAFGNLMFGSDGEDDITSLGRLLLPTVPPMEIDLLFGGPCDDIISAGDGLNLVFGGKENDTITAGDGINLLFGNAENDTITAGTGLNLVFGNRGNDTITSQDGLNVLFGNREDDTINAGSGLNIAFGGKNDDTVQAGAGVNILFGNAGVDHVEGGAGLNVLFGNKGDDEVIGGPGLSVLFGNKQNDQVTGGAGLCVAFGNADHDEVTGGPGLAVLFGNGGEDRVRSSSGLGVLFGNGGNDILQSGGPALFIAFGNGGDDVLVGAGGLNLLFGNTGNDQFFGGGGTNIAFGNKNNDTIRGDAGVDFLFGNLDDDQMAGGGNKDFMFGNRGNDCLSTEGGGDYAFGNRGNDHVRSGSDSNCDWLFGNRGNDNLYRCQNCDKRFGGRGSDTKHDDCGGCSLSAPARGEVRGRVTIDFDGDGIGDVPQPGVTVTAGSGSAITDADGNYRIAGLGTGGHTVAETVPTDFVQVSLPTTYSISIGSQGIDLHVSKNFVNRPRCFVSLDGWSCTGAPCAQPGAECRPVVVRRVSRCSNDAICGSSEDCPCGSDCTPSWAIEECSCDATCWIDLDPVTGPSCGGGCIDGTACNLIQDGDLFYCGGCETPCPVVDGKTFEGFNDITNLPPQDWLMLNLSQPLGTTGWFQGNPAVFPAHAGPPNSYIAADENNGANVARISNWLILPARTLSNGDQFSFFTRTALSPISKPDRLQVRMSLNCCSTEVGGTSTSVGDFTTVLLDINPTYSPVGYPFDWTGFNVVITGLPKPTCGRLAFRYLNDAGGPLGPGSTYIGIDTVNYLPAFLAITDCPCAGDMSGNHAIGGDDIQEYVNCVTQVSDAESPACSCATLSVEEFVGKLLAAEECP